MAFERAALADARREIADTLQRSLLPRRLPRLDGLAVSARYLPGVVGTAGRWRLVRRAAPRRRRGGARGRRRRRRGRPRGRGDGPAAQRRRRPAAGGPSARAGAGAAGPLRRPRRRSGGHDRRLPAPGPGHRAAHLQPGRPPAAGGGRRGRAAAAGRAPWARRSGWPAPGRGPTRSTVLDVGSTLVLYTDGLVERRGIVVDDGVQQLTDVADRHRTAPAQELLRPPAVRPRGRRAGRRTTSPLVAARLLPAPLRLDLPAQPERLAALRRTLEDWAVDAALDTPTVDDLQLALGEAAANAVEHAYREAPVAGRVRVRLGVDGEGTISARVEDDGTWRTPPGDRGFRGRGLEIARNLTTAFDLEHGTTGTTVRFDLRRPDAGVRAATWQHRPRASRPAELVVSDDGGRTLPAARRRPGPRRGGRDPGRRAGRARRRATGRSRWTWAASVTWPVRAWGCCSSWPSRPAAPGRRSPCCRPAAAGPPGAGADRARPRARRPRLRTAAQQLLERRRAAERVLERVGRGRGRAAGDQVGQLAAARSIRSASARLSPSPPAQSSVAAKTAVGTTTARR